VFHLLIKTTRIYTYLEGLNSSLAQSAAELRLNKTCPIWANHTFQIFVKIFVFWPYLLNQKTFDGPSRAVKTRIIA